MQLQLGQGRSRSDSPRRMLHCCSAWYGDMTHAGVMHFTSSCRGDLLNGGFAASQQLSPQCCELPFRSRREAVRGGRAHPTHVSLSRSGRVGAISYLGCFWVVGDLSIMFTP